MKIFLKTLGLIFSFAIAGLVTVVLFLIAFEWNMTVAAQVLNEKAIDVYGTGIVCIGMAILLAFCPTWFAINEAINNHFD